MTAHVYISNRGASALRNHTDKTEVIVAQLAGRRVALPRAGAACAAALGAVAAVAAGGAGGGSAAKLPKYGRRADEMASENLECNRVAGAGAAFHLPRRTIHSARAPSATISRYI